MFLITLPLTMALALTLSAQDEERGKYNPTLAIGSEAPRWTDLPGVDDQQHSFDDLDEYDAIVVVFTCNSCPYAVDYEDRIIALHERFSTENVAVVAINVNKIEEDRLEAMKVRAEEKGFQFPYLFDESQQIAKDYGATFTPEFFVVDRDRKIAYMGGFDDSSKADQVEHDYLVDALQAVLSGRAPEPAETVAFGCRIRIERSRRDR